MTTVTEFKQHKYLNTEFFEKILQKHHSDVSIKVTHIKLEAALGKGENYASDIIRAQIRYMTGLNQDGKMQQYIVKASLADSDMQDMLEEYDVFHREIVVYEKILPVVESLLLSINVKTKLAPRYTLI